MLQFLGAFFVVFACGALAFNQVYRQRAALINIEELKELFITVKQHICFSLEPLPELIHRLAKEDARKDQIFLQHWSQSLLEDASKTVSQALKDALLCYDNRHPLPEQAREQVLAMGESLGKMDCETESSRIQRTVDALDVLLKKDNSKLEKSEKTVKSMGIICGIFIVILLI